MSLSSLENMVRNIRSSGMVKEDILSLFRMIDRAKFIPEEYLSFAYCPDWEIPLPDGQYMLTPLLEGLILQNSQLSPEKGESVLCAGIGSGYLVSLLSQISSFVYALEYSEEIMRHSAKRLRHYGNLSWELGNVLEKDFSSLQFDVIILTMSIENLPESLLGCLNPQGGRILAIHRELEDPKLMHLVQYISENNSLRSKKISLANSLPAISKKMLI